MNNLNTSYKLITINFNKIYFNIKIFERYFYLNSKTIRSQKALKNLKNEIKNQNNTITCFNAAPSCVCLLLIYTDRKIWEAFLFRLWWPDASPLARWMQPQTHLCNKSPRRQKSQHLVVSASIPSSFPLLNLCLVSFLPFLLALVSCM